MKGNAQITDGGKTLVCFACGVREALKRFAREHDKCTPGPTAAPES